MTERRPYHKCKNCGIPYQRMFRCRICGKLCCNNCSGKERVCIDCFVQRNVIREQNIYTNDKIEQIGSEI